MGSPIPVQSYNLRSAGNSYIGASSSSSLHDLNNTVDSDDIPQQQQQHQHHDNNDALDCLEHDSYPPLHADQGVVVVLEDERSTDSSRRGRAYHHFLTIQDVNPIEDARARFMEFIINHFINHHVIEVGNETDYTTQDNKLIKRKTRDVHFEGDPQFALPLMYIANLYEGLVNDVNVRLASLNAPDNKTIGLALEAAGGLYRKLAKKFPKKGAYMFRRRELATSLETRTKFPELVTHEEKRVRFTVINGLEIVEKPNNMPLEDVEWFKRLTGRTEIAVHAREYKHYSPRHKFRRAGTISISNMPSLPTFSEADNSSEVSAQGFRSVNEVRTPQSELKIPPKHHRIQPPQSQRQQKTPLKHHHIQESVTSQPEFHPIHQSHHQHFPQNQSSHLPQVSHQTPTLSQNMQPLSVAPVTVRMHIMPTSPAKFCDECGSPYLRETSKFCSKCGSKRLGI
ncbi:hypothetical protein ACFE04_020393 [Oxalis oulophora]